MWYILPDEWTEQILPLEVDPTPDEMVRTLVGRVEVMTQQDEEQIADAIRDVYDSGESLLELDDRRFSEPRIRRGCELIEEPDIHDWCRMQADVLLKGQHRVSMTW